MDGNIIIKIINFCTIIILKFFKKIFKEKMDEEKLENS